MEKKDTVRETIARVLSGGFISLPEGFFSNFSRLGLNPQEGFLILQLWYLTFSLHKPAGEAELAALLGLDEGQVLELLAGLISKEIITYEEQDGQLTYNLDPLLPRLFEEQQGDAGDDQGYASETDSSIAYRSFEGEFKRPLSPIEVDFLKEWLEVKGYALSMILEALKVAVAGGKLSFSYIDHILIDWEGKGVSTLKENKEYEASHKPAARPAEVKKPKKSKGKGKYEDIYLN